MKNAYPDKPVLQYQKTTVEMADAVLYLKSLDVAVEVKRAAYTFFRFESANGTKGINNNFTGAQCDGNRWPKQYDEIIVGTVIKAENGTGNTRIFPAFGRWQDSLYFTATNAQRRGLYVGGETYKYTKMQVVTPADLCTAYKREWVTGNPKYIPTAEETKQFLSVYKQAVQIFQ